MKGPIGVFDSGYGGLTVLKSIREELPQYDYHYLGDNARTPYGTRSFDAVYQYTLEAVKYLFAKGCPLVILACNTASAKALRNIQQLDLPRLAPERRVLGIIRPTSEIIGQYTETNEVGVLGTSGTISSNSYRIEIEKFFPGTIVHQEACPMWVPLVENNELNNAGADYFVRHSIDRLLAKSNNIDSILLACTHYPLLLETVRKFVPESIKIITQGDIVAKSLVDYLNRHPEIADKCAQSGYVSYNTTDDSHKFDNASEIFLGKKITSNKISIKSLNSF